MTGLIIVAISCRGNHQTSFASWLVKQAADVEVRMAVMRFRGPVDPR